MLFALFTLAALSAAVVADNSECNPLDIIGCAVLIDRSKTLDNTMPENEESLDTLCEATMKGFRCLHDFAGRCKDLAEMEHLGPYFQAQYHILDKVCTKGNDLRKRYLASAKCVNGIKTQTEKKCGVLEENFTTAHCQKTKDILKCMFGEIQSNCGADTLSTMKELLEPTEKLVENVCKGAFSDIPLNLHQAAMKLF